MKSSINNRLYIIGNGFDLYHELPTSYDDFRDYVSHENPSLYMRIREYDKKGYFARKLEGNWSNIENSLDLGKIISNTIENDVNRVMEDLVECFVKLFYKWIGEIEKNIEFCYKDKPALLALNNESHYITFNYTKTLELLYGVHNDSELRVLPIHGRYDEHITLDELFDIQTGVFRFGNKRNDEIALSNDDKYVFGAPNHFLMKNVVYNQMTLMRYLERIKNVDEIWVLGCALDPTNGDLDYFSTIFESLNIKAVFVSYYSSCEIESKKDFFKGITAKKINFIKMDDLKKA